MRRPGHAIASLQRKTYTVGLQRLQCRSAPDRLPEELIIGQESVLLIEHLVRCFGLLQVVHLRVEFRFAVCIFLFRKLPRKDKGTT